MIFQLTRLYHVKINLHILTITLQPSVIQTQLASEILHSPCSLLSTF